MSAAAQAPALPTAPDPPEAPTGMPSRIGRVLAVVRRLIDYGKRLAGTIQNRAAAPGFALFARPFGTTDLAVILARITNGLRRAAALEARLSHRAARGQDLAAAPIRAPAAPTARPARRVTPPDAQPGRQRTDPTEDPRLTRLPTEQEIAAEVRRRPVGAVIVDICRDLGIMPGDLDRAFWDELSHAIMMYGGTLVRLFPPLNTLLSASGSDNGSDHTDPGWPAAPPRLTAPATGPP